MKIITMNIPVQQTYINYLRLETDEKLSSDKLYYIPLNVKKKKMIS